MVPFLRSCHTNVHVREEVPSRYKYDNPICPQLAPWQYVQENKRETTHTHTNDKHLDLIHTQQNITSVSHSQQQIKYQIEQYVKFCPEHVWIVQKSIQPAREGLAGQINVAMCWTLGARLNYLQFRPIPGLITSTGYINVYVCLPQTCSSGISSGGVGGA